MKSLILLLILSLSVINSFGSDIEDQINIPSSEEQRRAVVRELRQIGFQVLEHHGRTTLMEYSNPRYGYFYQVLILSKKDEIELTGFAFMKPNYKWSYRIAHNQACNHLKKILQFSTTAANGQRYLESYLW